MHRCVLHKTIRLEAPLSLSLFVYISCASTSRAPRPVLVRHHRSPFLPPPTMTFASRGYSISQQQPSSPHAHVAIIKGKYTYNTMSIFYHLFLFLLLFAETFAQELDLERKARQQQSAQQNQQQSQHSDRDIKSPVPGTSWIYLYDIIISK